MACVLALMVLAVFFMKILFKMCKKDSRFSNSFKVMSGFIILIMLSTLFKSIEAILDLANGGMENSKIVLHVNIDGADCLKTLFIGDNNWLSIIADSCLS